MQSHLNCEHVLALCALIIIRVSESKLSRMKFTRESHTQLNKKRTKRNCKKSWFIFHCAPYEPLMNMRTLMKQLLLLWTFCYYSNFILNAKVTFWLLFSIFSLKCGKFLNFFHRWRASNFVKFNFHSKNARMWFLSNSCDCFRQFSFVMLHSLYRFEEIRQAQVSTKKLMIYYVH